MRPIPAEKTDPKVQARDALMGITEKKDNGRVALVMSLASLARAIYELARKEDRDYLINTYRMVLSEIKLTDREKNLLDFESKHFGV
jgi:hypothetical protein